jgi:predicted ATPase
LLKKKRYDFVVRVMLQAASHQPTLLWVEEAHWLDASSAELLQEIVRAVSDVPSLLVVLTRLVFPQYGRFAST